MPLISGKRKKKTLKDRRKERPRGTVVSLIRPWDNSGSSRRIRGVIRPHLGEKLPLCLVSHYTACPSGLITLMVVAVIKASWLQTLLFVSLHKDSLQDACGSAPPPLARMQCRQTPWTLELSHDGVGQVIAFEEEKARNHSGPADTLIIWLVWLFSCNNALHWSHPSSHSCCACLRTVCT